MQGAYIGQRSVQWNSVSNQVVRVSGKSSAPRRWRSLIIVLVAVAFGMSLFSVLHHNSGVASADTRDMTYTVHPGETLWSIAVKTSGAGVDTRAVVREIMEQNHMQNAAIYAGEKLLLPNSH